MHECRRAFDLRHSILRQELLHRERDAYRGSDAVGGALNLQSVVGDGGGVHRLNVHVAFHGGCAGDGGRLS